MHEIRKKCGYGFACFIFYFLLYPTMCTICLLDIILMHVILFKTTIYVAKKYSSSVNRLLVTSDHFPQKLKQVSIETKPAIYVAHCLPNMVPLCVLA